MEININNITYELSNQNTLSKGTLVYNLETKELDKIADYENVRSAISEKGRVFHCSTSALGSGWIPIKEIKNPKNIKYTENIILEFIEWAKDCGKDIFYIFENTEEAIELFLKRKNKTN